jgi:hypothetical protein
MKQANFKLSMFSASYYFISIYRRNPQESICRDKRLFEIKLRPKYQLRLFGSTWRQRALREISRFVIED